MGNGDATRHGAPGHLPLVAVVAQVLARHGPAGDLVGERVRRILTALPGVAVQAAELPALRRVDSMEADMLTVDFERVAVDHRGDAGHVGQGRGGEQGQGEGQDAHLHMVTRLGQKGSPLSQLSAT